MATRSITDAITNWETTQATNFTLSLEESLQYEGVGCLKIAATSGACIGESVLHSSLEDLNVVNDAINFKVRSNKTGAKMRVYVKNRGPVLVEDYFVYDTGTLANDTNDWVLTGTGTYQHRINAGTDGYDLVCNASGDDISAKKSFTATTSGEIDFFTNVIYGNAPTDLNIIVREGSDIVCRTRMRWVTEYNLYDNDLGSYTNVNPDKSYTRIILKWAADDTYEIWACINDGTPALIYSGSVTTGMTNGADSVEFQHAKTGSSYSYWRLKKINCNVTGIADTPELYEDITIATADTWQTHSFDISGFAADDKDDIRGLIFQCIDDSADFNFYIDNLYESYEVAESQWCLTTIIDGDIIENHQCKVSDGNIYLGNDSDGDWGSYGSNLLTNSDAETGDTTGWTDVNNFEAVAYRYNNGSYCFGNLNNAQFYNGYQIVDLTDYSKSIAVGAATLQVINNTRVSPNDSARWVLNILDSDSNSIYKYDTGYYHGDRDYHQKTKEIVIPVGGTQAKLSLLGKRSGDVFDAEHDDLSVKVKESLYYDDGYVVMEKEFDHAPTFGEITYLWDSVETLTVKVQSSADGNAWVDWADIDAVATTTDISDETYVTDGHKYLRFRIDMSTTDTSLSPEFDWLCLDYKETQDPCPAIATEIDGTVIIDWTDNSSGEEQFELQRKVNDGDWEDLIIVGPGITTYTDSTVSTGNIYYYRVRVKLDVYSWYCETNAVDMTRKKHVIFCVGDELRRYNPQDGSTTILNYYTEGLVDVTNGSDQVIASGTSIHDCELNWTAEDGNIASSAHSGDKTEGTYSVRLIVDAAATAAQVLAYYNLPSAVDCSDLKLIRFDIQSSINTDAGDYLIILYDSASKTNEVFRFPVPALTADTWKKVYVPPSLFTEDNDESSISCISIYQVTDKGALTLYIDDFQCIESEYTAHLEAGDIFSIDTFTTEYIVDSVDDYGQLTLTENYDETTSTGQSYKIKLPLTANIPMHYCVNQNRLIGTNYVDLPFEFDGTKYHRKLVDDTPDGSSTAATEGATGTLADGVYNYKFAFYSTDFKVSQCCDEAIEITISGTNRAEITGLPRPTWRYDKIKIYRTKVDAATYYFCKTIDARTTGVYDEVTDANLDTAESPEEDGDIQVYAKYPVSWGDRVLLTHTKEADGTEHRSRVNYSAEVLVNNRFNLLDFEPVREQDGDLITGAIANWLDSTWVFKENSVHAFFGTDPSNWFLYKTFAFIGSRSPRSLAIGKDMRLYYLASDAHIRRLAGLKTEVSNTLENVQTDELALTHIIKDFIDDLDKTKLHQACGIDYEGRIWMSVTRDGYSVPDRTIIYDYTSKPEKVYIFRMGFTSFVLTDENVLYGTDGVNNYIYQIDTGTDDDGVDITCTYKSGAFVITPGTKGILQNIKLQYDSASSGNYNLKLYTEDTEVLDQLVDLSVNGSRYGKNPNRRDARGQWNQIEFQESSQNAFTITHIQALFRVRERTAE